MAAGAAVRGRQSHFCYAVATGNYTWRGRLPGGTWGWNQTPQFRPGQKTVGHLLQAAGYRTGLFGKLHDGGEFEPQTDGRPDFTKPMKTGPLQWGFDFSPEGIGGISPASTGARQAAGF